MLGDTMNLAWLTGADLGVYPINQAFLGNRSGDPAASSPILLAYVGPITTAVTMVSGMLPPGLTWTWDPNWITITGRIATTAQEQAYSFTMRLEDGTGARVDRTYYMQVQTNPVPRWITPGNLGSFPETYSFNLNPISLQFSAASTARLSLHNGSLPPGLSWARLGNSVLISGESTGITTETTSEFTFRLRNPNGSIADRTFSIRLIPGAALPSWTGQQQALGYVGSGRTQRFRVHATSTQPITYGLLDPIPPGMGIDPWSGVITYAAEPVSVDTTRAFTVRARTSSGSADLLCSIVVLTVPHAPVWITAGGQRSVAQGSYFQLRLEAYDPLETPIIYLPVTATPDFPYTLDTEGLLYGLSPRVDSDTPFSITIKATTAAELTGPTVSTDRTFTMLVQDTNAQGVLEWNDSIIDLVGILDGRVVNYDLSASSDRGTTIRYSVIGGQLPRGLMLEPGSGYLHGFLEFHPIDKDYWFDIAATDGVDTLIRTIHARVISSFGYQYMGVSIPVQGDIKELWQEQNHALVGDGSGLVNVSVENNQFNTPSLPLVQGLAGTLDTQADLLRLVKPYMSQMRLSMAAISGTALDGNQLLSRAVADPQDGAARQAPHLEGRPPVIYPNSLENLRAAWIDTCGYANAGGGTGAAALALLEPEDGSIKSVLVTDRGSGYHIAPVITVQGTGSGASLEAVMELCNLRIVDPGSGWTVGDEIDLGVGLYRRAARLVVSSITGDGGIAQYLILDPGDYLRMPYLKYWIQSASGGIAGVQADLCVNNIVVTAGGSGYGDDLLVAMTGSEMLPSYQTTWQAQIPMMLVTQDRYDRLIREIPRTPAVGALDGAIWQVDTALLTLQGQYWQGTTRFDGSGTTFDGDQTRYIETVEPRQTLLDRGDLTWDLGNTVLDAGDQERVDVITAWGRTLIDDGQTAFDFYATVFDPATTAAQQRSSTEVQRILHLRQPQLTGNNVTNGQTVTNDLS